MGDKKRGSVKSFRGILGPISGHLIGINFNKNNTCNMTPPHFPTPSLEHDYFVGGFAGDCKIPIAYIVTATSPTDAVQKVIDVCPDFNYICTRILYN